MKSRLDPDFEGFESRAPRDRVLAAGRNPQVRQHLRPRGPIWPGTFEIEGERAASPRRLEAFCCHP